MNKLTVEELDRLSSEEYKSCVKLPVVVVLDNVRSMYNIGSVFRTCDSFRIEKIFLCGITATPDRCRAEIHKTALGAENTVEWEYSVNTCDVVEKLRKENYCIVAVEQVHESRKLDSFTIKKGKYALFFGNEVKGVDQKIVDECEFSLEIPQYGTKHSLNVSVSAGIVLWEFARQLAIEYLSE